MLTISINNVVVSINNKSSKDLEKCTIEHTGEGGHPIKLGNIKSMKSTSEEMCISTSRERSKLIFTYTLNGETYSSTVYDNIFFTDIRPINISIFEENNTLLFKTARVRPENN